MENKEQLLKYGWREFLNSPFSLIFCFLCFAVSYLIWKEQAQSQKDKERYEIELKKCNEERLKDRMLYNSIIENRRINDKLKEEIP